MNIYKIDYKSMSRIQNTSRNFLILGTSQSVTQSINPPTYTSLNSQLNASVDFINVVAVDSKGLVYVGGGFSSIGGVTANNVAVYNPTTQLWSALGSGVNNAVRAIAIDASDNVYFGGFFSSAGGSTSNGIARWNASSSTWSQIGGSTYTSFILSIKVNPYNSNVYVGGIFTSIGTLATANYMAIYNPSSNTWAQFTNGTDSPVTGFVFTPTNIYICGYFTQVNGNANFNRIASFNTSTSTWTTFGTGFDSLCNTMIGVGNLLYVGGQFTSANGNGSIQYIAQINTSTGVFSALPGGPNGSVEVLVSDTNNIFVGGSFLVGLSYCFAVWVPSSSSWITYGTGLSNTSGSISVSGLSLTSNNNLYISGIFTSINSFASTCIVLVNFFQQISQNSTYYLPLRKTLSKKVIKLNK